MLTYSEAKQVIEEVGRNGLENLIESLGESVISAGIACDVSPNNMEEAYQGNYRDDESFVKQLLSDCGDIPELPNYVYIDWERTAKDVMIDYCEDNGHYFRNM